MPLSTFLHLLLKTKKGNTDRNMHQTKFPHTEIMHAFKGLTLHNSSPKVLPSTTFPMLRLCTQSYRRFAKVPPEERDDE